MEIVKDVPNRGNWKKDSTSTWRQQQRSDDGPNGESSCCQLEGVLSIDTQRTWLFYCKPMGPQYISKHLLRSRTRLSGLRRRCSSAVL